MDKASREQWARSLVGTVVAQRYRLDSLIGMGGMGAVFAAEHVTIGRRVAVKLVTRDATQSAEVLERFQQEARAAAAIERRGVVEVFDFGVDPALGAYLVMEQLRGEALSSKLKREKVIEPRAAARYTASVLETLAVVHARGIVHRDLKPANLFLAQSEDGGEIVKVLDFGVSRMTPPPGRAALTVPGTVLGTPRYMAPEQAIGAPDVDARADVYSAGAVLYTMLGGKKPYAECTSETVIVAMCERGPIPLRTIRGDLRESLYMVVDRAMARDRAARFQSANEMLEALREAMPDAEASWPATRPSVTPPARPPHANSVRPPQVGVPSLSGVPRAPWLDATGVSAAAAMPVASSAPRRSLPPPSPAIAPTVHAHGVAHVNPYAMHTPFVAPVSVAPPRRWPWALLAVVLLVAAATVGGVLGHRARDHRSRIVPAPAPALALPPPPVSNTNTAAMPVALGSNPPSLWAAVDANPTLRMYRARLAAAQTRTAQGDAVNARAMLAALRDELAAAPVPHDVAYQRLAGHVAIAIFDADFAEATAATPRGPRELGDWSANVMRAIQGYSETSRTTALAGVLDTSHCAMVGAARASVRALSILRALPPSRDSNLQITFDNAAIGYVSVARSSLMSALAPVGDHDPDCDAEARQLQQRLEELSPAPGARDALGSRR